MQRQFLTSDTSKWVDRFGSGSDGALTVSSNTTDSTANTTITGTSGGTSATTGSGTGFANGNLVIIHQTQGTGVGTWELNKIASVGSGTNWTMTYSLINTYGTGAQVYLLKQYSSYTINSSQTLTGLSWNGSTGGLLAVLCNGPITITGNIAINNCGFRGGAISLGDSGQQTGLQGEGETGTGGRSTSANGMGGGGSSFSSSNGWNGGSAGHTNSGSQGGVSGGSGTTGSGGNAGGDNAKLTTMFLGGGGAGGGVKSQAGTRGEPGGNGGGIVILIGTSIVFTGTLTVNGNSGTNGSSNNNTGGGGGAGGSILLKSQKITLGSNLLTALGGTEGTDMNGNTGTGTGSVGRIHADYSTSITGTTNPTIDTFIDNIYLPIPGGLLSSEI